MSAQKTKTYEVIDVHGTSHVIEADYVFDNQGTLVLRRGERGSCEMVASFAPTQWTGFLDVTKRTVDA